MANVDVTFVNPAINAEMDVELDDAMTAEQVIQALIDNDFIEPLNAPDQDFVLAVKGKQTVPEGQSLANAGVETGDQINVNVTQRGGSDE